MEKKQVIIGLLITALCVLSFVGCNKKNDSSAAHQNSSKTTEGVDKVIINDNSESGVIVDFNTGSVVGTQGDKAAGSTSKDSTISSINGSSPSKDSNNDSKATDNKSQTSSGTSITSSSASSPNSGEVSETTVASELTTMDGNTPWE